MPNNFRGRIEPPNIKEDPVIETSSTQTEQPIEEEKKPDVIGVVVNCLRLKLRSAPIKDEDDRNVISFIPALSEVVIDMTSSTEEFYKVCNSAGIQGFCMKQYIALR